MDCTCAQFAPLELTRKSINKRIKAAKAILKSLDLLVIDEVSALKLLRCPDCNQYWQTGREWNFGNGEYPFQVPAISVQDWLQEAYTQPATWLIYLAIMEQYMAKNILVEGDKQCSVEGCQRRTIRFSGSCEMHHIEQLQRFGLLPQRPTGRLFALINNHDLLG
jgi:hypothetical protein